MCLFVIYLCRVSVRSFSRCQERNDSHSPLICSSQHYNWRHSLRTTQCPILYSLSFLFSVWFSSLDSSLVSSSCFIGYLLLTRFCVNKEQDRGKTFPLLKSSWCSFTEPVTKKFNEQRQDSFMFKNRLFFSPERVAELIPELSYCFWNRTRYHHKNITFWCVR